MSSVQQVALQTTTGLVTERDKAVALHDYVRDDIRFGFTRHFDAAQPEYTLRCRVGHCNPKSRLMVALLRAVGFEAYQHFVAIPKDILEGAVPRSRSWLLPAQLSHSYVDVKVEDSWCEIDTFIVDTPLLRAAQVRLAKEGRTLGYAVRADSTNVWDGRGNAFSQFAPEMMIEDHGRVADDPEDYFRTRAYRNRRLGLRFDLFFTLMGDVILGPINSNIERIRAQRIQ